MCPAYRSKDDAFVDMYRIAMSGIIDWLVQYVKESYPDVEDDYKQQKREIENDKEMSESKREYLLDELEEKHSMMCYIDESKHLLSFRSSLFPECNEHESFWVGELYKCGLTDTYFTDVSFNLNERKSKSATVIGISHRIMEIPIPRPQCIQLKIKNGETVPPKWRIKTVKKKVKKGKKSSKKAQKGIVLDEEIDNELIKYAPPADRQVVKYLLHSYISLALCLFYYSFRVCGVP